VVARESLENLVRGLQFAVDLLIRGVICLGLVVLIFGIPGFLGLRALIRRRRAARQVVASDEK